MIRWIRDWLGTGPYDAVEGGAFRVVDVRHHVDKAGNAADNLRRSIDAAVAARRAGERIVVACDFGISRSNAIAAGVLSRVEQRPFDDALADVISLTGETQIKLELIESVRAALEPPAPGRAKPGILVTGGSGFLGRALVARLASGHDVCAPPRAELDLLQGGAGLARLCREREIGQIVHLAYPRHYTNPAAVGESMAMLKIVLDVAKALDLRLVLVSGWVVFSGYRTTGLVADETLPLRTSGSYGDAKLVEETLLGAYAARGDVRAAICRLAPVYGPGGVRPRLIRNFGAAILAGRPVVTHRYRNGRPALDLLHVEDAVSGLVALLEAKQVVGPLHFGTGRLTETRAIASCLARGLEKECHHQEIAIDDDVSNIALDSAAAQRRLGWTAEIGVERGLLQMCEELVRPTLASDEQQSQARP